MREARMTRVPAGWVDPETVWRKVSHFTAADGAVCSCGACVTDGDCDAPATSFVVIHNGYGNTVHSGVYCARCKDIDLATGLPGCCGYDDDGIAIVKGVER